MNASTSPRVMNIALAQVAHHLLFLPFWWYSIGLGVVMKWSARSISTAAQTTGLTVWAKNLFVPMYGETTFSGKLISFFMRLVMIIGRGIATGVWAFVIIMAFFLYLTVFPLAIIGAIYHGIGLFFV